MYPKILRFSILLGLAALLLAACQPAAALSAVETPAAQAAQSPVEVVQAFYTWYLNYAAHTGNPLVDKAYQTSPYLDPAFVAGVDEIVAGFDQGGYDPILLAQDVPERIEPGETAINGDQAEVQLLQFWSGNATPRLLEVHLRQAEGRWLITGVRATAAARPSSPEQTVQAFYDAYLTYIKGPEGHRNPLVDGVYRESPYLTPRLVAEVDGFVNPPESTVGMTHDYFLCAQEVPAEINIDSVYHNGAGEMAQSSNGPRASVLLRTNFPSHYFTLSLLPAPDGAWQIDAVTCGNTPEGTVTAFYTWYLAYNAIGPGGTFRNAMTDGAYRTSDFLTPAGVARIDALLASFTDSAGYDPFLMAQNIPLDFTVETGAEPGRVIANLEFVGPHQVQIDLVPEGAGWLIDEFTRLE